MNTLVPCFIPPNAGIQLAQSLTKSNDDFWAIHPCLVCKMKEDFLPIVTMILSLHLEKKLVKHTKWLRPDWKWWVGMTEQDPGLLGILFWWAEAYFLPTAVTWLCINLLTRTFYTPGTIPVSGEIFTSEKVHKRLSCGTFINLMKRDRQQIL